MNTIYNEDCLEGMKRIPDGSVDMILCDLPYGTTTMLATLGDRLNTPQFVEAINITLQYVFAYSKLLKNSPA